MMNKKKFFYSVVLFSCFSLLLAKEGGGFSSRAPVDDFLNAFFGGSVLENESDFLEELALRDGGNLENIPAQSLAVTLTPSNEAIMLKITTGGPIDERNIETSVEHDQRGVPEQIRIVLSENGVHCVVTLSSNAYTVFCQCEMVRKKHQEGKRKGHSYEKKTVNKSETIPPIDLKKCAVFVDKDESLVITVPYITVQKEKLEQMKGTKRSVRQDISVTRESDK